MKTVKAYSRNLNANEERFIILFLVSIRKNYLTIPTLANAGFSFDYSISQSSTDFAISIISKDL